MSDIDMLGRFEKRGDDHIDVRFERHYPRPMETVWRALTEPERLADWMGVSEIEPRVGGRIRMMLDGPHPMHGTVLEWDPPRVLAFSWSNTHAPNSVIRYELYPDDGGTRVSFTHIGMPYATSALMLPGWHDLLQRLGSVVEGRKPAEGASFRTMQAAYVEHYRLEGVQMDP